MTSQNIGGVAYMKYDYLLPQSQFTVNDIFKYIVYVMQKGASVVFDFYKLEGGPYGYSLPASIVLTLDKGIIGGKVIYSGYPPILYTIPTKKTRKLAETYLTHRYFERVSYIDVTGFKMLIARKSQLLGVWI